MADETYISEHAAMQVLTRDGDFTHGQAAIVLLHSKKQGVSGANYYPMGYVYKRANANALRPESFL